MRGAPLEPGPSRPFAERHRPGPLVAILVTAVLALLVLGTLPAVLSTSAPTHRGNLPLAPAATSTPGTVSQGCDGMYWAQGIAGWYDPTWCYGHDEPTISYVSNAPHSGEDASFHVVLPSDTAALPQGDMYATFWFGGVVADANSTAGGGAAFLELQFYPSPPAFTGSGSGHQDCLPNGAFNYVWTPGSNDWFVCAIVWQLTGNSASPSENAAIATPLDLAAGSDQIFEMHSGDQVFVNYSGIAQTTPWNLHVTDTTLGVNGSVILQNGSLVLSPYYTTAAASNVLGWSASGAGAIAFAYEVGHALNPNIPTNPVNGGCVPGDLNCDSYWPGKWSASGQADIGLPILGSGPNASFPQYLGLSSSQGGETEVNQSACVQPSFSTLRNCMYPFFLYRSGSYGLSIDADLSVSNITHDYGNEYEFPGDISTPAAALSSDPHHTVLAPWGTVNVFVNPSTASVEVNPVGGLHHVAVAGGEASGQYLEGAYYVNVSASGCTAASQYQYVSPGSTLNLPVDLSCGSASALAVATTPSSGNAPLPVSFLGAANGGTAPYSYTWAFGDGSFASGASATHTFGAAGTYNVVLHVLDAANHPASAAVAVDVLPPVPELTASQDVTLYAHNVSALAGGGIQTFPMSTRFPAGEPDFNSFYIVPVAGPSSWTFSLPDPTSAPLFLDTSGSAIAHFFVSLPTSNLSTPAGGVPLTVSASLTAGSFLGQGAETQNLNPGGAVEEYNLSLPLSTGSVPSGSPLALTVSWYEARVAGESLGWPIALHTGQSYPISVALPLLDPIYLSAPSVTTSASGVSVSLSALSPFGAGDLQRVRGVLDGVTSVVPTVRGSTYTWSFPTASTPGGFHTLVATAYDLQGAYNQAVTGFQIGPTTYTVTFTETGLPSGTTWEVTLGGATYGYSSSSTNAFTEPNGTYAYSVGGETNYFAFPAAGSVTVAGANLGIAIAFRPSSQAVGITFKERGLARGTIWSVDLGGDLGYSNSSSIGFLAPEDASYPFSVAAEAGYSASPSSGTVAVGSSPLTVTISFQPVSGHHHGSPSHGPSGLYGTPEPGSVAGHPSTAMTGARRD